ncbi:MAG: hypothetical protein R2734_08585 [Nocardioides sp.]
MERRHLETHRSERRARLAAELVHRTTARRRALQGAARVPACPPPAPLGAFGFLAGLLVLDKAADVVSARAELVAGRAPAPLAGRARSARLVHEDRIDDARRAFDGTDPVSAYHLWLLAPDARSADDVRAALPASVAPSSMSPCTRSATGRPPPQPRSPSRWCPRSVPWCSPPRRPPPSRPATWARPWPDCWPPPRWPIRRCRSRRLSCAGTGWHAAGRRWPGRRGARPARRRARRPHRCRPA